MKREPTPEELEQIERAIFAGDRIEATNLYISITECGLTAAQKFVAAMTATLQASNPDDFQRKSPRRKVLGIF